MSKYDPVVEKNAFPGFEVSKHLKEVNDNR